MQLVTLVIELSILNWLGLENERQSSFMGFSCFMGRGGCLVFVLFFTERSQQLERFLFQYPVTTNSRAP